MYGCFRDNKPMSALFCESKRRWEELAQSMVSRYHMWDADEVDTLIRTHYAFLWETYKDVRRPVMRADMGRVAVLHRYGGPF